MKALRLLPVLLIVISIYSKNIKPLSPVEEALKTRTDAVQIALSELQKTLTEIDQKTSISLKATLEKPTKNVIRDSDDLTRKQGSESIKAVTKFNEVLAKTSTQLRNDLKKAIPATPVV